MQKAFTLMLGVVLSITTALAASTGFTVEEHAVSDYGTTYRIYATFDNPEDWVLTVYGLTGGEGNTPMSLLAESGSSIYHSVNVFGLNPNFGGEVNPLFFAMVPDLVYDSWLTIGVSDNTGSAGPQGAGMADALATFNAGTGFDNCGGAWFVASTSGPAPEWQAGDDLKVLLAQITMTDNASGGAGHFSFQFNMQWKGAGNSTNYFEGPALSSSDFIVSASGCTDSGACNYAATATEDDGSCEFTSCAGCADAAACNYDAANTIADNTQCEYLSCTGCTNDQACNYDASATADDGSCVVPNAGACEVCNGAAVAVADSDGDGTCDGDEVVGCQDDTACNYNSLATDAGTCEFASASCEVCQGGEVVLLDDDGDGICNADEAAGCTNDQACNYAPSATDDDGSCEFTSCAGCLDSAACNYDASWTIADNAGCDYASCLGCTNDQACNYDDEATQDDGSCDLASCYGCSDNTACNYDATALFNDGSCTYPEPFYNCEGDCQFDFDGDGICNELEIDGCMDNAACNFNAAATDNVGCEYPPLNGDCDSVCTGDFDGDGICDNLEVAGCTSSTATNFNGTATDDDGSCVWDNAFFTGLSYEIVGHNTIGNASTYRVYAEFNSDLVEMQACFGTNTWNWNVSATSPFYQNGMGGLLGHSINDLFFGAIPELAYDSWFALGAGPGDEPGPSDVGMTSFTSDFVANGGNFSANTVVGASIYYTPGASAFAHPQSGRVLLGQFTTEGVVTVKYNLQFRDENDATHQVTDLNLTFPANLPGCTDPAACNYDSGAEFTDADLCAYAAGCDVCSGGTDGTGTVVDNDADDDGVCDADEIEGCVDPLACNYDATATTDANNALCVYPTGCESCSGEQDGTGTVVDNDADNDGVCDADEIAGCRDASACNYDATATTDENNALCVYATGCDVCSGETDGTGTVVDNDADDDGVCDANEIEGCVDPLACNYDATATTDANNDLCVYPTGCESCSGEQDGTGTVVDNDADNDGVCDADEVEGCRDASACNYDATSTTDANNTLCVYPTGCESCSGEQDGTGMVVDNDADNDGVCDAEEIEGCVDPLACNYDATATTDANNALCVYPTGCESCSGEQDGTGTVVDNDADNDGVCDADEIEGCLDASACNYDATATTDENNALCTYATGCDACSGEQDGTGTVVDNDADDDGVCDLDEVPGCTDSDAVNFDADATDNDGSCAYGECDDPLACNYVEGTEIPAAEACQYPAPFFDCEGNCTGDYDGDGICEGDEVWGCASSSAVNFDAAATNDDGSCIWGNDVFEGLTYEVVTDHETGPIAGNGYVTYRVYAQFSTSDIDLVQLFGNATHPWIIENTADVYQSAVGGDFGGNIPLALFSFFPEVEFDSWLTIGAAPGDYNAMNQTGMYAYLPTWNASGDFVANGVEASISVTPSQSSQGVPDANGRVLLAQITTNGVAHVQYNILFHPEAGQPTTFTDVELTFPTQVPGCTDPLALNYEANANSDDGTCQVVGCMDPTALNFDPTANIADDSCLFGGCTDESADNFDPVANVDDDSCLYTGCFDAEADNYNAQANTGDQEALCEYQGCTNPIANNYDAQANVDNGSCLFTGCFDPEADNYNPLANTGNQNVLCRYNGCTDPNAVNFDPEANFNDGSCDYLGCMDQTADNYSPNATIDNGSCLYTGCFDPDADNFDEQANTGDQTELCLFTGCFDPEADNYDLFANTGDQAALCEYWGCTDPFSDNFDPAANAGDQEALCVYLGCTDADADNFDVNANTEDGTCLYAGCTDSDADNFDPQANDDDGSCIYLGCTNLEADNFDVTANQEDGSCLFSGCMDAAADNYWPLANTGDQVALCAYLGCTNPDADNFDLTANTDDGSCIVGGCMYLDAANFNALATYDNGTCQFQTVGCTDPTAWNYMESALEDNGTCLYGGCTYDIAFNFDPAATVDDGSCEWLGCTDVNAVNFAADASHDDGSCEVVGCMDPDGINYNADATFSGYCEYPDVCPGDINGDLSVDVQDLLTFFQYYGTFCN